MRGGASSAAFAAQQQRRRRREIIDELLKDASQDGGRQPPPGGNAPAPEPPKPPPVAPSARRATALLWQLYPTAMTLSRRRAGGVSGGAIGPASPVAGPWRKPLPQPWIRTPRPGGDRADAGPVKHNADGKEVDKVPDSGMGKVAIRRIIMSTELPLLATVRRTSLAAAEEAWQAKSARVKPALESSFEVISVAADELKLALTRMSNGAPTPTSAGSAAGAPPAEAHQRSGDSAGCAAAPELGATADAGSSSTAGVEAPHASMSTEELIKRALADRRWLLTSILDGARANWIALGSMIKGARGDTLRRTIKSSELLVSSWVRVLEILRPGLLAAYPDSWGRLADAARKEHDTLMSLSAAGSIKAPDGRTPVLPQGHVLARAVSGVGLLAGSSLPDACLDPLACAMLDVLAEDLWRLQLRLPSSPGNAGEDPLGKTSFYCLLISAPRIRLPPPPPPSTPPPASPGPDPRCPVVQGVPFGITAHRTAPSTDTSWHDLTSPPQLFAMLLTYPVKDGGGRGTRSHFDLIFSALLQTRGQPPLSLHLGAWQLGVAVWEEQLPLEELHEWGRRLGRAHVVMKLEQRGLGLEGPWKEAGGGALSKALRSSSDDDVEGDGEGLAGEPGADDDEEEQERREWEAMLDDLGRGRGREARAPGRSSSPSSSASSRGESPARPAQTAAAPSRLGLYDVLYGTGPFGNASAGLQPSPVFTDMARAVLAKLAALGLSEADDADAGPNPSVAEPTRASLTHLRPSDAASRNAGRNTSGRASSDAAVTAAKSDVGSGSAASGSPAPNADAAVARDLTDLLRLGRSCTAHMGGMGLPDLAFVKRRSAPGVGLAGAERPDALEALLSDLRLRRDWDLAVMANKRRAGLRSHTWIEMYLRRTSRDPAVGAAVDRAQGCRPGEALVGARALAEALRPGLVAAHPGTWGRLMDRVEAEAGAGAGRGAFGGLFDEGPPAFEVCRWALNGLALLVGFEGLPRARLGLACCALGGKLAEIMWMHNGRPETSEETHMLVNLCVVPMLYMTVIPPAGLFPPPPEEGWVGDPAPAPRQTAPRGLLAVTRTLDTWPAELSATLAAFCLESHARYLRQQPGAPPEPQQGAQPGPRPGSSLWDELEAAGAIDGEPFSRGWMEAHARDVAVLCAQALADATAASGRLADDGRRRREGSTSGSGNGGVPSGGFGSDDRPGPGPSGGRPAGPGQVRLSQRELDALFDSDVDLDSDSSSGPDEFGSVRGTGPRGSARAGPIVLTARTPNTEAVEALLAFLRVGPGSLFEEVAASGPGASRPQAQPKPQPKPQDTDVASEPAPLGLVLADAEAAALALVLSWQACPGRNSTRLVDGATYVAFQPQPWLGGGDGEGGAAGAGRAGSKGVVDSAAALPAAVELGLAGGVVVNKARAEHLIRLPELLVTQNAKIKDLSKDILRKLLDGGERTYVLQGKGVEGALRCLQLAITVRTAMQQAQRDLAVIPLSTWWRDVAQLRREAEGKGRGSGQGGRGRDRGAGSTEEPPDILEDAVRQLYNSMQSYYDTAEAPKELRRRLQSGDGAGDGTSGTVAGPSSCRSRPQLRSGSAVRHLTAASDLTYFVQGELREPAGPVREGLGARLALIECEPGRPDRLLWPAKLLGADINDLRLRAAKRGTVRVR